MFAPTKSQPALWRACRGGKQNVSWSRLEQSQLKFSMFKMLLEGETFVPHKCQLSGEEKGGLDFSALRLLNRLYEPRNGGIFSTQREPSHLSTAVKARQ